VQRFQCITRKPFVTLLFAAAAFSLAGPAAAAESPCTAAAFRAFDFWLGDWEVRSADGKLAGHNSISARHQGCLLQEQWTSAGGGTGSSMNFYDPAMDAWRQVWVSGGTLIDISGELQDGSMVLVGTITYLAGGEPRPFRGTWTPLADGRVRQFFEEQREGSWHVWFEGFYAKTVE